MCENEINSLMQTSKNLKEEQRIIRERHSTDTKQKEYFEKLLSLLQTKLSVVENRVAQVNANHISEDDGADRMVFN